MTPLDRGKISPRLAQRLASVQPDAVVRVLLLVDTGGGAGRSEKRMASRERERAAEAAKVAGDAALPEIDEVMVRLGGRRLDKGANALGGLAVEVTRAAAYALAGLEGVKAIMEDQPVRLVD